MLILAGFGEILVSMLVSVLALLLIGLVLLQKNRGSGLSGAFGGVGGYSAFGTKTGDFLTWVTVGVTGAFLLMCVVGVYVYVPDYTSTGATIEPGAPAPAGSAAPGARPATPQPVPAGAVNPVPAPAGAAPAGGSGAATAAPAGAAAQPDSTPTGENAAQPGGDAAAEPQSAPPAGDDGSAESEDK